MSQSSATRLFKLKTSQSAEKGHVYRVMEVCTDYEAVVMSYQSQDNIHGIRKVSLLDLDNPDYIPLHSKSIRDIKSSPHQPDVVISTGLDKSLAITSLKSNTKLHSYSLDLPAWSCHIDQHDPNILYCGLVNSTIMVFDIRNSKTHVKSLSSPSMTSGSPLHSIQSIRVGGKNDTLLCSNLMKTFWWQDPADEHSTCTVLDVNNDKGRLCSCFYFHFTYTCLYIDYRPFSVSALNNNSNNNNNDDMFLVSSRHKQSTQHQLIKALDDGSTKVQQSIESPYPQVSLCRTQCFIPNNAIVCCYAEESTKNLCLQNTATQDTQRLSLNAPLLDVKSFQNQLLLALTEHQFCIYNQ
jgi:hypothetical protein